MDTQLSRFWRDWKVVATSGHLTLAAHPLDYVQFRANGSHQVAAADRLIEHLQVASFRFCGVLGQVGCHCETRRRL